MARIRSIHPGLFTDEAFMTASPHGRLLVIGLWCEAFDDGCVELKLLTLKARIFPVDTVDMAALLGELEGLGYFRRFTARGKEWAALRNFRRFQRPKKPNASGVLPQDLVGFVGLGSAGPEDEEAENSEPASDLFPTSSPKPAQREDGGGNRRRELEEEAGKPAHAREDAREPAASPPLSDDREFQHACTAALGGGKVKGSFAGMAALAGDRERIVEVLRAASAGRAKPIEAWTLALTVASEGLAVPPPLARGSPPPPTVFVAVDTPEWRAWDRQGRANGHPRGYPRSLQEGGRHGWRFPTLWPPGAEAAPSKVVPALEPA